MARRRDWGAGEFGDTSTVSGERKGEKGCPVWHVCENEVPAGAANHVNEALMALGNGFIGVRGTFEEGYDGPNNEKGERPTEQGIYINGFYEEHIIKYPEVGFGQAERDSVMLNVVNSKVITLTVDGAPFSMYAPGSRVDGYHRELDLKNGTLVRELEWTSPQGKRVAIRATRIVCLGDTPGRKHLWATEYVVTPLSSNIGEIVLSSELDAQVTNKPQSKDPRVGSGLSGQVLKMKSRGADGEDWCFVRSYTEGSKLELVTAMRNKCTDASGRGLACTAGVCGEQGVRAEYRISRPAAGQPCTLTKYVAYVSSQGPGDWAGRVPEARLEARAREVLQSGVSTTFNGLRREQAAHLDEYWRTADIVINGNKHLQQGLRFNSFHLLQGVGRDSVTNIGAKGITGEGYCGHYFWDTEVYMLPFFIYCAPDLARNLVLFRVRTLDKARERAQQLGGIKKGALYPWRTIHGEECSSYFPAGTAQMHINADIGWAIKQYVQMTNDTAILKEGAAEVLIEMARFWLSYGSWSEGKLSFQICCVTGPDEYTCLVNNNYYTNIMVQDTLQYTYDTIYVLKHEHPEFYAQMSQKIGLEEEEIADFKLASEKMFLPYDRRLGVHPQDDSFLKKEAWDFENTPLSNYPLLLHYHYLVIYKFKVIKQADLVLALLMQGDKFTDKEKKMNYDYYEPLTTHDSSLSTAVYSVVASEIGYYQKAYNYFRATVRMDLDNIHHNTQHGIHTACMAGAWMCVVRGFGGMRVVNNVVHLNPHLPHEWGSYKFCLRFTGGLLQVTVTPKSAVYACLEGKINFVHAGTHRVHLRKGHSQELLLKGKFEDLHALSFDTVILDLDTVLPGVQATHFEAWKRVLAELATRHPAAKGITAMTAQEYVVNLQNQIAGQHRFAGLSDYLKAKGIDLPLGDSHEPAGHGTCWALANTKTELFQSMLRDSPLRAPQTVMAFLKSMKREGIKVGVVSFSKSGKLLLENSGVMRYIDAHVTGQDMGALGLRGKPHADMYERVVEQLYTDTARAVIVIDDPIGFDPGALGHFKYCIGFPCSALDPTLRRPSVHFSEMELEQKRWGMDRVIQSLSSIDADTIDEWIEAANEGREQRIARTKALRQQAGLQGLMTPMPTALAGRSPGIAPLVGDRLGVDKSPHFGVASPRHG